MRLNENIKKLWDKIRIFAYWNGAGNELADIFPHTNLFQITTKKAFAQTNKV